jgi:Spy/CpxP family protein refolding chaperone
MAETPEGQAGRQGITATEKTVPITTKPEGNITMDEIQLDETAIQALHDIAERQRRELAETERLIEAAENPVNPGGE